MPNVVNEIQLDASEIVHRLMEGHIGFSIHYPGTLDSKHVVVTVKESVNNSQLRTLTDLGANMQPNGVFHILCEY